MDIEQRNARQSGRSNNGAAYRVRDVMVFQIEEKAGPELRKPCDRRWPFACE